MMFLKRIAGAAAFSAALLLGASPFALRAQAAYLMTLTEQGPNVVANGAGTIDLTGFTFHNSLSFIGNISNISPAGGIIVTGPTFEFGHLTIYGPATGPANFGNRGFTDATSGGGFYIGVLQGSGSSAIVLQ